MMAKVFVLLLLALMLPVQAASWHLTLINQSDEPFELSLLPTNIHHTLPSTLSAQGSAIGEVVANHAVLQLRNAYTAPYPIDLALWEDNHTQVYRCQYGYQCALKRENKTHYTLRLWRPKK